MKAGYRKRAAKADRLMDNGKPGGFSLSTLDRLDRATADEAAMVERCLFCPKWKFEGSAAECRGARAEHRRVHELGLLTSAPAPGAEAEARRRRVLKLRTLDRLSLRAIAAEVGVSVAQVHADLGKCSAGEQLPERIVGLDGRQRPARRSERDSRAVA